MTADWVHLPYEFLMKISNEIINNVIKFTFSNNIIHVSDTLIIFINHICFHNIYQLNHQFFLGLRFAFFLFILFFNN